MKLKKGFTLIELLAVLIILAVILAIIIPVTNSVINNSKQSAYDSQIELLLDQALKYSTLNNLGTEDGVLKEINFTDLVSSGLIPEHPENPITGDNLEGCIVYKWNSSINQYEFEYDVSCNKQIINPMISATEFQSLIGTHRETITDVVFNSTISNNYKTATLKWDLSTEKDEAVVGYIIEEINKKTLHIEANGKIIAHEQLGGYCSRYDGNFNSLFCYFNSVTIIEFNDVFDTSKVTNMSHMFYGNNNLINLDLSSFDTSNVTDMSKMFSVLYDLTSLNLSNFNTSNVTNMSGMFSSLGNLSTLDLSSFNTSKVTDMSGMFSALENLNTLDLSNFNTSNVTNMSSMFSSLGNLNTLDLSSFNTSNVTNMSSMFEYSDFSILDLNNFDTSNVTNMSSMFMLTYSLDNLIFNNFNYDSIIEISCFIGYNPWEEYYIDTYVPSILHGDAKSCGAA